MTAPVVPPSYIRCYIYDPTRSRISCNHCGWETTDAEGEGMSSRGIWVCMHCDNIGDFTIIKPFVQVKVREL